MAETWAPTLDDVARVIPTRTRDRTPGSDTLLGTFTSKTTPTDAQAQQVIDDAVAGLLAVVGDLPANVTQAAEIQVAARMAVQWRAAADIEVAYPNRDADVRVYDQLNARANDLLDSLKLALSQAGSGLVDTSPEWAFPLAPSWGDQSPGSGADYQMGPY